jgi:hypothetical protein
MKNTNGKRFVNLKIFNMAVGVVTSSGGYVFDQGSWHPIPINGQNPKISASDETIAIVTSTAGFVFNNGRWQPQKALLVGDPRDIDITVSRGVVGIMTSRVGYAFNRGQWFQQTIAGTPKAITSTNGNILLITNSHAYAFDSESNRWSPAPLNGMPIEYTH